MDAIYIYMYELLIYSAIITSISLLLMVVVVILMFKNSKKVKSLESSWHSFLLGSHKHKEKYPVHHHHH